MKETGIERDQQSFASFDRLSQMANSVIRESNIDGGV